LRDFGVTAVELMPVADFPGRRNWGYDGVLPFAPDSVYGRPDELKRLVDAAHALGLMVFLDVVYNHFGPDGNYLRAYARDFFTERHHTPWGAAINYDGTGSRAVRDFFIHNALYWLEEFHFDGLRLDAVHAIIDDSGPDILVELAQAVRAGPGREREVHLVLENDDNCARYLECVDGNPRWYDAQWNDDAHHALHVLLTGERDGYYADYADEPAKRLGRSLAEGFVYQGDFSAHRGRTRGEASRDLPATSFVAFLQNHDQVGNRALGERLTLLASPQAQRAGLALLLLAPWIPLMFMGDEFGCEQPFPFFCDFSGDLARAVREGRRSEFAAFAQFQNPEARERIPDPNAQATFDMARIDWAQAGSGEHAMLRDWVREVLRVRALRIAPLLPGLIAGSGTYDVLGGAAVSACWKMRDGGLLSLAANLGDAPVRRGDGEIGKAIYAWPETALETARAGRLPPWSVVCHLREGAA
jgi:malto-oligosyltrehalose trehalohydrolase